MFILSVFCFCFWTVREENKQQPKPSCADVSWSQGAGEQGNAILTHFLVRHSQSCQSGGDVRRVLVQVSRPLISISFFCFLKSVISQITSYLVW